MKLPESTEHLEAATRAARSLQGLSVELTARVPQLLEAMRSVGTGLELHSTLDRICETAAELADARYAAIGVVDESGEDLSDFVTHGVDAEAARHVGHRSAGLRGLLGALIDRSPQDVRSVSLRDVRTLDDLDQLDDPEDGDDAGEAEEAPETGERAGSEGERQPRTFLEVPIRVHGALFGNLYLAGKRDGPEGGGRTAGDRGEPRSGDAGSEGAVREFNDQDLHVLRVLATEAGIAIGHARLYEAARQRERWIDGSVAVTTALLSGGDSDALAVVAEQARRLADAAAGVVLLPTPDSGLEIVAISSERTVRAARIGSVAPPESPVVQALLAGESVFVDDSTTDRGMITNMADGFGPCMLLPLQSGGRVLGALVTPRSRRARRFTETERILAAQFASQAALALMMAEAQRDRERLAVLEDRDRIARDLHDLVIQRLFATGMMLESAQRGPVVEQVQEVHQGIDKAVGELDVTIQEIRTAIFALQRGPAEAPSGLRTRVLREIKTAAVPLGFQPARRFVGPVDGRVGELTGKNLIAALREALSNAFRHAQASRIEVVVDATARLPDGSDAVRLSVADDGVGIPDGGRRSGLRNLQRRAESLGGSSRCLPGLGEDGGGTTVVWEAPL